MTRCHLLYELISKKGFEGVCGLPKSQIALIKKYMPFIEELSQTTGIPEEMLYDNVPASSVKTVLTFKKGSDIRTKAENHIIKTLKSKRSPT